MLPGGALSRDAGQSPFRSNLKVTALRKDAAETRLCRQSRPNQCHRAPWRGIREGLDALTTATVVGYNITESRLYYSYAGHSPAYLWRRADHRWSPLRFNAESGTTNLVLGVLPSVRFDQDSTPISQGDRVFIYTDGVIECRNPEGEAFGAVRLLDALGVAEGESLADLKNRVVKSLRRHAGPAPFHDDITFMLAEIPQEHRG